jgi:hypothetical protein
LTFIKRSRIISTRVSEDEYAELRRISRERGASSVSDYVRRLLVNGGRVAPPSETAAGAVAAEIAALHRKVDWLAQVVEHGELDSDATRRGKRLPSTLSDED